MKRVLKENSLKNVDLFESYMGLDCETNVTSSGCRAAPCGDDRDVQEREGPHGNADYASRGEDAGVVESVQQVQLPEVSGPVQRVWNSHHECEEEYRESEVYVQQGADHFPS